MTKDERRGEFAKFAMQAILVRQERGAKKLYSAIAQAAWAMADAMLDEEAGARYRVTELPDNTEEG
jgi:hypothetical protein